MSLRYKGGVISATPPTTTGGESGSAPGVWTLEQQMQINAAGNWPIQPLPKYIEDVFSTYLYTGTGSSLTITNNIDFSTEGGMLWYKNRGSAQWNILVDTVRGGTQALSSNDIGAQATNLAGATTFNTNGFTVAGGYAENNASSNTYASWSFRKEQKFFDVVTYTGNGTAGRTVNHNLGSVPGCIIIKSYSGTNAGTYNWNVYHRGLTSNAYAIRLNEDGGQFSSPATWNSTTPTSTQFTLGDDSEVNGLNTNFVAYLFAHDAGGFGANGTDNVISCGSYTGNGSASGPVVTLGYEPQWVLIKRINSTGNWLLQDNMRSLSLNNTDMLFPNLSNAATTGAYGSVAPNATGFQIVDGGTNYNASGGTYIYIAIRRGPMKTPTSGTSVYNGIVRTGTAANASITNIGFAPDLVIGRARTQSYSPSFIFTDKLRGYNSQLASTSANEQTTHTTALTGWLNNGYTVGTDSNLGGYNLSTTSNDYVHWPFQRAPGFFDIVCYTGTGSNTTINHNLGTAPQLMFVKSRTGGARDWVVYSSAQGNTKYGYLNYSDPFYTSSAFWNNTTPTSTVFSVGTSTYTNGSGYTYVAYLFASVSGVSSVGSYTGSGTTKQIDCGFTGGARFVLIKRTDVAGDWYLWDSARGIVAGNDPYLQPNSTSVEVTNTDYVDTYSAGFEISSTAPAAINANGGTFIYLAIA